MSDSEWKKVEYQEFINRFNNQIVVGKAPVIMHSRKDKEHEAFKSLVALIFTVGFTFIYIPHWIGKEKEREGDWLNANLHQSLYLHMSVPLWCISH